LHLPWREIANTISDAHFSVEAKIASEDSGILVKKNKEYAPSHGEQKIMLLTF